MKMRHLFFMLLALPLAFAACEPTEPTNDPNNTETPDNPENPTKEPVLTLTSEVSMQFGAEGGEGVIT